MPQRNTVTRRNINADRRGRTDVFEGSAVRSLQARTDTRSREAQKKASRARRTAYAAEYKKRRVRPRTVSRQALNNREKAKNMNRTFVVCLAIVSALVLFFCVHYIQLRSEITTSMKMVASLESELSDLREDNDAYYSQVTSEVDLNRIKKIAISRLGMSYPSDDQTETYISSRSSFIRQYQDLPSGN